MTVEEFINKLKALPLNAEVMVEIVQDECEVCSNLKHESCSLEGNFRQFADTPYYHEASDECRIGCY